jgi:hypothetical protein
MNFDLQSTPWKKHDYPLKGSPQMRISLMNNPSVKLLDYFALHRLEQRKKIVKRV